MSKSNSFDDKKNTLACVVISSCIILSSIKPHGFMTIFSFSFITTFISACLISYIALSGARLAQTILSPFLYRLMSVVTSINFDPLYILYTAWSNSADYILSNEECRLRLHMDKRKNEFHLKNNSALFHQDLKTMY